MVETFFRFAQFVAIVVLPTDTAYHVNFALFYIVMSCRGGKGRTYRT